MKRIAIAAVLSALSINASAQELTHREHTEALAYQVAINDTVKAALIIMKKEKATPGNYLKSLRDAYRDVESKDFPDELVCRALSIGGLVKDCASAKQAFIKARKSDDPIFNLL